VIAVLNFLFSIFSTVMKSSSRIIIILFLFPFIKSAAVGIDKIENVCVPKITYFDKNVYNAANQTWAIAQNKKGYMYFANSAGLLEYDGSQWQLYQLPDNTSNVRSIAIADDQKIYTGVRNEFGYWSEDIATRKLKYTSLTKASHLRFADEEIWKIVLLANAVYFHSFKNIYKYNTQTKSISIIPAPNRFQFLFKANGRLFVQEKVLGLMELKNDKLIGIPGGDIFTGDCVYGMESYSTNSILIATIDKGLYKMENERIEKSSFPCNDFLVKNQIFSMTALPGGKYAFGTILNGLLIADYNGNIVSTINKPKGMPNNTVLSVFSDQTNNLWLGLDRGICHIQMNSPIRTFPDPKGVLGSVYQVQEYNGRLFFATNQGLFSCAIADLAFPERELSFTLMPKSQGQVWALVVVGNKLLCAHNKGVYAVEGSRGDFIYTKSGATHWLKIDDRTVLFLTYDGLCVMHINGGQSTIKEQSVFPYDGSSLAKDKDNNIYIGSISAGFYKVKFDPTFNSVIYSSNQLKDIGIDHSTARGIYSYNGNVFAVDAEKGILKYDYAQQKFMPDPVINRVLPKQVNIHRLQMDAERMWCYASGSFFCIKNYLTRRPSLENRNMESLNKQLISTYEDVERVSDGAYMVCTSNSFAVMNTKYSPKTKSNPVYLRDIGTFTNVMKSITLPHSLEYYKNHAIEFPYRHNTIFIRFTLPDYENEGNIRYSYRLKGNSENFSIPSTSNMATFTNLPAGDYVFQVKATIVGTNEVYYSQELRITILPPWYMGWIGLCLVLLSLLGVAMIYYKYLQRRWQKEQKRIELEHEKEMSKMENRLLQEQIRSQTDELSRVTKSMLHKNKLMNKLDAEIAKLALNKMIPTSELRGLKHIVEKNKNPDEEWKVFEMSFNKTHDNYLVKLSTQFPGLTTSDLKLAAYIRMNISSKEIAGLLNISVKSVEMARYRLRKKLNFTHEQNLTEFLIGL
jgi:ligand-binding sensor domain-containing protein/DNA-binding CsgD family transcriptional regulator